VLGVRVGAAAYLPLVLRASLVSYDLNANSGRYADTLISHAPSVKPCEDRRGKHKWRGGWVGVGGGGEWRRGGLYL